MAVDFVKTGQPAQMSRDLFPRKWPHFMEKKKPLEQTYHSRKVLGQLYDQVERVDFVPAFTAPFDSRILEAYELGEEILHNAYEVKVDYDAHMRRIMAQQEIGTEFEVWSTFVLHHAKGSGDYKYHEQIGELSMALKDQFRALCYEQAGGKQFEQIGPFVAAMYQVTAREMLEALKECSQSQLVGGHRQPCRMMTSAKMPLMSFPWLFQGVLGKIASNNTFAKTETTIVQDEITSNVEIVRDMTESNKFKRHRVNPDLQDMGDDLETADGTTHRGDLLELFENSGRAIVCKDTDELGAVPSGATSIRSSRSSTSTSMGAASSIDEMLFSESLSNSPGLLASEPRDQSTHPTFDPTVLASALARGSSTLANEQGSNHDPCSNDTTTMKGDYNGASDSSSEIEVPAPVATSPGIHQILNRRAGPNSLGNASQAEYEYVSAHDKILYDDDDVVDTDDGDGGDIDKPTKAELMPVAPNMRVLREEEPENVKTKKLSAKDEFDNFSDTDSGSEQYAIASETKAGLLDQLMLIGGEAEFAIRDAKYIEASRSTS